MSLKANREPILNINEICSNSSRPSPYYLAATIELRPQLFMATRVPLGSIHFTEQEAPQEIITTGEHKNDNIFYVVRIVPFARYQNPEHQA